jgi:hypothetical protein
MTEEQIAAAKKIASSFRNRWNGYGLQRDGTVVISLILMNNKLDAYRIARDGAVTHL